MSIIKKCITLFLSLALVIPSTAFVFAQSITLTVEVGSGGTVNGKSSTFTQSINTDSSTSLDVKANSGYVVDDIKVNGDTDDSDKVIGKSSGTINIPAGISDDLTIKITFKQDSSSSGGTQPSGDNTQPSGGNDQPSSGDNNQNTGNEPTGDNPATSESEFKFKIEVNDGNLGNIITTTGTGASVSGTYKVDDLEEDRRVEFISIPQADGTLPSIESVTVNGEDKPEYKGKPSGIYMLVSGDVEIKVNFTTNPNNASDPSETSPNEPADLTGGVLGLSVDGTFIKYEAPNGDPSSDDYYLNMTMIDVTPSSSIKVAVQKNDKVYEASNSYTGQDLWNSGETVNVKGLETFKKVNLKGEFPENYTVPESIKADNMKVLVYLSEEPSTDNNTSNGDEESNTDDEEEVTDDDEDSSIDEDITDEDSNDKSSSNKKSSSTGASSPKTGDDSNPMAYLFMSTLSALALTLVFIRRKLNEC